MIRLPAKRSTLGESEEDASAAMADDFSAALLNGSSDSDEEPLAMRHLTPQQKEQLGVLLEEYMTALESGMPPSVESLTETCPQLREPLQACVGGLENLFRMSSGELPERGELSSQDNGERMLGDFQLHEEIGRGGMGVVYRATQKSLRRDVAIKLLPLTSVLDSRQLTRFHQEAEAAASLQHPNIVPVFAVGCERGIHYYAMQHVVVQAGAQVHPTDWKTAVDQAAQVAEGLHATHELGIIHRDIKPSNLLIDQSGKPWITDFGLARIQSDVSLTQSGDVIGTMRYMSPEQARGESAIVDGRTDVYSLGATLYEMLAGTPAHDGEDAPSIVRQIADESIIPLRKHRPDLPRDLETVVAKAMASRRDDRYETAEEFAKDLRRILAGESTEARPPSLMDRGVRLATKYRVAVATIAAFGVLALIGFGVSNRRLAAEKRNTDAHAAEAVKNEAVARDAIDRLGSQMAELLSDIPAASSVRHQLLTETLGYYERLASESSSRGSLGRQGRMDLAMTHGKIGSFQSELGRSNEALESLHKSQDILQELAGQTEQDKDLQIQWAISQNNLAEAYSSIGKLETATRWFGKAIANGQRLQGQSHPAAAIELATTLNNFGQMLTRSENVVEAETVFRRAIEIIGEGNHGDSVDSTLHSTVQSNLASLLGRTDTSAAIALANEALVDQLKTLKSDPSNPKVATKVVLTLNTLASAQAAQTQHRDAVNTLRQAIDLSRQLRSRWPGQLAYRRDFGISLNQLGLSLSALGQTERAAKAFSQSVMQTRALVVAYPEDAEVRSMLGSILNNAGFLSHRLGDLSEADRFYNEAVEHQTRAANLAPKVPRYAMFLAKHQSNLKRLRGES